MPQDLKSRSKDNENNLNDIAGGCQLFIWAGLILAFCQCLGEITGTPPELWLFGVVCLPLVWWLMVAWVKGPHPSFLKVAAIDEDAPKPSHDKKKGDLDVTSDDEMSYHIRGGGGKQGGHTLLDLAGPYVLRYWLPEHAKLSIHLYNLYNQHTWWLVNDVTGVGTITVEIDRGRYEFTVRITTPKGKIGDWLLEIEPVYGSALDGTESDSELLIAES